MKTLKQTLAAKPCPKEHLGGIYEPVHNLLNMWDWGMKIQNALIAGENVPHAIVAEFLEKDRCGALPPSRRKDYPDLAVKYPICYELTADGKRVLV